MDFVSTKITGVASGAFTVGETVTQATTNAIGIFVDHPDVLLNGTQTGTFVSGELVTQATSGAKGFVHTVSSGKLYVYPIYGTFVTTSTVTGKTSTATVPPTSVATGKYHLIYRTTTTEFDNTHTITGSLSAKTITPTAVTAPPNWMPWSPHAGYEGLPEGGANIGALCFGRLFLNDMYHPNQWYASRVGGTQPEGESTIDSTRDWLVGQDDVGSPVSSQNSKAGLVGDAITAMVSYKDDFLLMGCATSIWVLRGDPSQSVLTRLTDATGIFSQSSWCWDDKNNLYFVGTDGIYRLSADAIINSQPPTNLTKARLPKLVTGMKLNRRTDTVTLGFDKDRYGVMFSASQNDGVWNNSFWLSLITDGVFPQVFTSGQAPMGMMFFDSYDPDQRGLLMGGSDGYIRKFDPTAKNDDGGSTINSFAFIGPVLNSDNLSKDTRVNDIDLSLGADSDPTTVTMYSTCYTAERLVHGILTGVKEFLRATKVFSTSARHPTMKNDTARRVVAFKLGNNTSDEAWYIENFNVVPKGQGNG
jgi:hypothetical protein